MGVWEQLRSWMEDSPRWDHPTRDMFDGELESLTPGYLMGDPQVAERADSLIPMVARLVGRPVVLIV